MSSRTDIFTKKVRDFTDRDVIRAGAGSTLLEVVSRMGDEGKSVAVIVNTDERVIGLLTEQDVVRRAAFRADGGQPVNDVMTRQVATVPDDQYLYFAIALMRRLGHRHMPTTDVNGCLSGMINLEDALAQAASEMVEQIDILTHDGSIDGLRDIKAAQVRLAGQLLTEDLPATEIQQLLSHINNDIHARLATLICVAMAESRWGAAPVDFSVIVMGSGGRGENFIYPDQDNGLIIDDYPDDQHTLIDGWFIEFSERLTSNLDLIGLPRCKGNVMATNPLWRKRRREWRDQLSLWSTKKNAPILRHCDIFFDFRGVWGPPGFAVELRHRVTDLTRGNRRFLRQMCDSETDHRTARKWFGRFRTETENTAHKGKINLKHAGLLPLVESIRLFCLREGIESCPSLTRLRQLRRAGVLNGDEFDYLGGAYRHISCLLLRQQIADYDAGEAVSSFVHPDVLSRREKDILTDSFDAIDTFHRRVQADFTGNIF